jgi:uncharacterized membrane protein YeiB
MAKQKEKKSNKNKVKLNLNNSVLLLMLLVSVALNFVLYTNSTAQNAKVSAQNYEEPDAIKGMGAKYKELLKTKNETEAQEDLINWVKNDPLVISAGRFNNGFDGLNFNYCSGSKGYGENSWQNLKN